MNNQNTEAVKEKKFPTFLKVILIALAVILVLTILTLAGAHFFTPIRYSEFFRSSKSAYETPGIYDGAIMQGYAYDSENDIFLHSAYMTDGETASRIYIVDGKNHHVRHVDLVTSDGHPYTGHVGGIAVYNDVLWMSSDDDDMALYVLSLSDIKDAKNGDDIALKDTVSVHARPSFCYSDGKYLWVGEFNNDGAYVTDEAHNFTVADGQTNRAIVCGYLIDDSSDTGLAEILPDKVLSIPNKVQGMAYHDGKWIFSTSYAFSTSHLYFYTDNTESEPDGTIEIEGVEIPAWFCDSESLEDDVELQPMAEGIAVKDGELYVSLESASLKYLFGNFTRGRDIYRYKLK